MTPLPLPTTRRDLFTQALDLLAAKMRVDETRIGVEFPYVTNPSGEWDLMPASASAGYGERGWSHGNWFCGFWVGLLAACYLHSRDERFLIWAKERMRLVAQRASDPNTHDIGFIFESSALPLLQVTGEQQYAEPALRAAEQLRARMIVTRCGAYISSWGPLHDERARRASAIDTMTNLPLLYWASTYTGDQSFQLAAEAHAKMTRRGMIRPDWSTYHAVEYDQPSGERARGYTFQGYADDSCWSRGQAWAIYGFAATASAMRDPEYLRVAEKLLEHFCSRLGVSPIPAWDFSDPQGERAPRDSSAAAITASAALWMADLETDQARADRWRETALSMLEALCTDYLAPYDGQRGLLMHGVYSMPQHIGTDSAVLFGDYFFVEALMRVLRPGEFVPSTDPLREALA